ncbi:MAG: pyridoxal phosphate-dependent aminotransferase [Chloroflexota bacterium]
MDLLARRATEISPFIVMEVLEEAQRMERAGEHVIHMEVGEPDFDTPGCATESAMAALRSGQTHYTHSMGIHDLREAIAEDYARRYGAEVDPGQIVVTQGTSPALFMTFAAILEPGDEVILANPYYACYPNFIRFAGGVPVYVDISEEDGYQLHPEEIAKKITPRTKAILINTVANPTGVVLDADRLAAIARLGPLVVSDEIYHGLVYEGQEHSILEYTRNACALNGFSKLYAMTGWRLGYVIAPPALARALQKIQQNFFISANAFVQWGALAALREPSCQIAVERMRQTYADRRVYMLERLSALGLRIPHPPTGAFYMLVNFRRYCHDSLAFAYDLLHEAKVATAPGVDFGSNAEGYLRFSYATSKENIAEGMDRLGRYLAHLHA